jgi:hypothetical protein
MVRRRRRAERAPDREWQPSIAAWSDVRATLELRREPRLVEVDAVAAHWDAFRA